MKKKIKWQAFQACTVKKSHTIFLKHRPEHNTAHFSSRTDAPISTRNKQNEENY